MAQAGDTIYATRESGLLVAYLQRNVTVQSLADAAEVAIAFDTAVIDRQGGWTSSPNPSRFKPTLAGWYEVSGMVGYASDATPSGTKRARWFFNGATIDGGFVQNYASLNTLSSQLVAPSIPIQFNGTTDYVELMARQSSGAAMDTTIGSTCCWIKLVYLGAA